MEHLLDRDLPWPDLSARSVFVVGLGEGGGAGACALASLPALRKAGRVEVAEVRAASDRGGGPASGDRILTKTSRTGGETRLLLLSRRPSEGERQALADQVAALGCDLYLLADLGGPVPEGSDLEAPPQVRALGSGSEVLDVLRRTGGEVWTVVLAPGAAGGLDAEAVPQVLSARAVWEEFRGAFPLDGLRSSLRRCWSWRPGSTRAGGCPGPGGACPWMRRSPGRPGTSGIAGGGPMPRSAGSPRPTSGGGSARSQGWRRMTPGATSGNRRARSGS